MVETFTVPDTDTLGEREGQAEEDMKRLSLVHTVGDTDCVGEKVGIEDALETQEGVGGAEPVNDEVTLTVELGVGVEVRVPGTTVMVIEGETEGERVGLVVEEALGEVFPV